MQKIAHAPWKDAPDLPGYSDWQALVLTLDAATQARIDDGVLRYHMVRGLVGEVIFAAGGVEREIEALRTAGQIAQAFADTHMPRPVPQPLMGPPVIGHHASHHAAYAVMNALTWIRAVQERVSRNDPRRGPAGLLPSLKDGPLKATIESHFANATPALHDARKFDNYVLHAGDTRRVNAGLRRSTGRQSLFSFSRRPNQQQDRHVGRIPVQRRPRRAVVLGQDICRCRNIHRRHAGRFRRPTITDGAQGKRGAARAVVGATARPVVDMSWTMTTILRIGVKATVGQRV